MATCSQVIAQSGIKFGTSGARGLVTDFTLPACQAFVGAFVDALSQEAPVTAMAVAIDNRPSSPLIAQYCIAALKQLNIEVHYYGVIPTPALAYCAMQDQQPCLMVTGSHIPFDRNGLKFYTPSGEITKADEQAILASKQDALEVEISELPDADPSAAQRYQSRYTDCFAADVFAGKKIGIYEHSSAGRELYAPIFEALGAEVIALERSDQFVPIDTEAVSDEDKAKAKKWSETYGFDMIFSTDGDGDRPLIADEHGVWLRGDILGLITAQALNLEALAVPVSCNTAIEASQAFSHVTRTKIGSPYVIDAFSSLHYDYRSLGGFEANGGFLLGSDVTLNGQLMSALPTRDAILPGVLALYASIQQGTGISALVDKLPQRFTDSDRIKNFATEKSQQLLKQFSSQPAALIELLGMNNDVARINTTDGLRMTLDNDDVIHLRPSGNAPELRCYAESDSMHKASDLVKHTLGKISTL